MQLVIGAHCAFEIPDDWCRTMSVTFVQNQPGGLGRSINLTAEPWTGESTVDEYAERQGMALAGALEGFVEDRLVWVEVEDRVVPVREYSWSENGATIRQCQAYLVGGDFAWTMTLTAGGDDYREIVALAPALISGFRPGPGGTAS